MFTLVGKLPVNLPWVMLIKITEREIASERENENELETKLPRRSRVGKVQSVAWLKKVC